MILSIFLQLLCLYGLTLDCYATALKVERRDDVLPTALTQDPRCSLRINPKKSGCSGALIERYSYNKKIGKCVDYDIREDCFQENANEFETREECWRACNRSSVCLKDDQPELLTTNRKHKLYYYIPEEDFCDETLPNIAAKNLWPKGNLFYSQKRCNKECKPRYKVKGKEFTY